MARVRRADLPKVIQERVDEGMRGFVEPPKAKALEHSAPEKEREIHLIEASSWQTETTALCGKSVPRSSPQVVANFDQICVGCQRERDERRARKAATAFVPVLVRP